MRAFLLPLLLVVCAFSPALAGLGDLTITSFIVVVDNTLGEVRGKVALNGEPAALVTVKNGGATYTTVTDEQGGWATVIALRSYKAEASARSLSGGAAKSVAEAAMGDPLPPGSVELFAQAKGMLDGSLAAGSAEVAKLVRLMDGAILHGGGWEFDNRLVLLMTGTLGRIAAGLDKAPEAERAAMAAQLSTMGKLLYKGVVRGMDGQAGLQPGK